MDTSQSLKILVIDDDPMMRLLIERFLKSLGNCEFADTGGEALDRLSTATGNNQCFDIIILDYELDDITGIEVLANIRSSGNDTPVIVLTGKGSEEVAVEALKQGAQDYLPKRGLNVDSLTRTVTAAIKTVNLERQLIEEQDKREKLIIKLQDSLDQIKVLHGLLPICAKCKVIRDDQGYWHEIDTYFNRHADITFSHGYCPKCEEECLEELDNRSANMKQVE